MEFYDDSPATRFFTDQSIVLSGGRKQDEVTREWEFTERILYINYLFNDQSISIGIFDDITRTYVRKTVYVKDYQTAECILKEIAKTYPGKVETKDFLPKWKVFYAAMKDSVCVESQVTDVDGSCGQCGDYESNEFIFLYVPAVPGTALNQSSLGLHWDFDCFGGVKHIGTYEDVVDDVKDLAERMESSAEEKYKSKAGKVLKALAKIS